MFGIVLVDNLRIKKAVYLTKRSCQICVLLMVVLYIVRILFYLNVHSAFVQVDADNARRTSSGSTEKIDKGFGSFLAEYVDSVVGSFILTIFWLIVYIVFFMSNFYMIYLMRRLADYIITKEEEEKVQQTIKNTQDEVKR
jgi:sensor domain CHASE-containing protein